MRDFEFSRGEDAADFLAGASSCFVFVEEDDDFIEAGEPVELGFEDVGGRLAAEGEADDGVFVVLCLADGEAVDFSFGDDEFSAAAFEEVLAVEDVVLFAEDGEVFFFVARFLEEGVAVFIAVVGDLEGVAVFVAGEGVFVFAAGVFAYASRF